MKRMTEKSRIKRLREENILLQLLQTGLRRAQATVETQLAAAKAAETRAASAVAELELLRLHYNILGVVSAALARKVM